MESVRRIVEENRLNLLRGVQKISHNFINIYKQKIEEFLFVLKVSNYNGVIWCYHYNKGKFYHFEFHCNNETFAIYDVNPNLFEFQSIGRKVGICPVARGWLKSNLSLSP